MEKFFETWKNHVINYRLKSTCFIAPLRVGILFIGYFNVILSIILIMGTASAGFAPTVQRVQELLMEGESSTSVCILAPTVELTFSVVLLCAMHRNDLVLLQFYVYYGMAAIVMCVLVYSLVIALINVEYIIAIILSILYQGYVIILVRSVIVEIKLKRSLNKNGAISTETATNNVPDVETPNEPPPLNISDSDKKEVKESKHDVLNETPKLATIKENPKETPSTNKEFGTTPKQSGAVTIKTNASATTSFQGSSTTSQKGSVASKSDTVTKTTDNVSKKSDTAKGESETIKKEKDNSPSDKENGAGENETAGDVKESTSTKKDDLITKRVRARWWK